MFKMITDKEMTLGAIIFLIYMTLDDPKVKRVSKLVHREAKRVTSTFRATHGTDRHLELINVAMTCIDTTLGNMKLKSVSRSKLSAMNPYLILHLLSEKLPDEMKQFNLTYSIEELYRLYGNEVHILTTRMMVNRLADAINDEFGM